MGREPAQSLYSDEGTQQPPYVTACFQRRKVNAAFAVKWVDPAADQLDERLVMLRPEPIPKKEIGRYFDVGVITID